MDKETKTALKDMLFSTEKDWAQKIVIYMKTLSPSGVELELLTLNILSIGQTEHSAKQLVARFLEALSEVMKSGREFDFVQALLNCCLKTHIDLI